MPTPPPSSAPRRRLRPAPGDRSLWYGTECAAFVAMYVFLPLGLYLMWRYGPWPLWLSLLEWAKVAA